MEHIAAILLVVGCSGDLQECSELPAPVPLYETAEECSADVAATRRVLDGWAERVIARCVDVDPALAEEDAELVWDVTPDGVLHASVEVPGYLVASNNKAVRNHQ